MYYNDTVATPRKSPQEFRILSTGDSFAHGIVKYPYTYQGVATTLLNAERHDQKVRIINLGEPCSTFTRYMDVYDFFGGKVEHDAVIFNIYLGNDIIEASQEKKLHIKPGDLFAPKRGDIFRVQRMRIPEKYPLRIMDYMYANYYLIFGGLQAPPSQDVYLDVASTCPEDVYLSVNAGHLGNYNKKTIRRYEGGFRYSWAL